jgi:uncharacterized protein YkwD
MSRRAWGSSLFGVLLISLSTLPASALIGSSQASAATTTVAAPTQFESAILWYINHRRELIGCPKLSYNSHLAYAARRHNDRMIAARTISHQLPGEPSLGPRATSAGYTPWRWLAENLAMGPTTSYGVYKLWMGSAPHRANIQNCTLRNVAVATGWLNGRSWDTLDFGRQ